jgi:hypothetical protein
VDAVDRHRPVVAGDVPLQLIDGAGFARGEEQAYRVPHPVTDDYGAIGVVRSGDVDVKPARPAAVLRLVLDAQRLAGRVSDRAVFDVEPRRPPLGGVVMEREIAIDPVPLTLEADGELLDDQLPSN